MVRKIGIEKYHTILKKKADYLKLLLEYYNNGREKTFFYLAMNLLDLEDIETVMMQLQNKEIINQNRKGEK